MYFSDKALRGPSGCLTQVHVMLHNVAPKKRYAPISSNIPFRCLGEGSVEKEESMVFYLSKKGHSSDIHHFCLKRVCGVI